MCRLNKRSDGIARLIQTSWRPALLVLAGSAAAALAGCGEPARETSALTPAETESITAGYLPPPRVEAVRADARQLLVEGVGAAGARVRLLQAGREAYSSTVSPASRWRIQAPGSAEPRLFQVQTEREGRVLEAEGRLLVLPDGRALMLRAGHGALPVGGGVSGPPRIVSVDVASDGAAAVSGFAPPLSRVVTVVDGAPPAEELIVGQGTADREGRFAVILASPLPPGPHQVVVNTPQGVARTQVPVSPAAEPGAAGVTAARDSFGWRISWRLPGDGVQTTYIPEPAG